MDDEKIVCLLEEGMRKIQASLAQPPQDEERENLSHDIRALKQKLRARRHDKGGPGEHKRLSEELARKQLRLDQLITNTKSKRLDHVQRQEARDDLAVLGKALKQYQKQLRSYSQEFNEFLEQKRETRRLREQEQQRQEEGEQLAAQGTCKNCLEQHASDSCPYMFDSEQDSGLCFEEFLPYSEYDARNEIVNEDLGEEDETETDFPPLSKLLQR
eukprot:g35281.t1